jgi:hypothetical protein
MIVFSRLCVMIVAGKIAYEAVFIALTMLGARDDVAFGGASLLAFIAMMAAITLLMSAQDKEENERFAAGVKQGYAAGKAARAEPSEVEEPHRPS